MAERTYGVIEVGPQHARAFEVAVRELLVGSEPFEDRYGGRLKGMLTRRWKRIYTGFEGIVTGSNGVTRADAGRAYFGRYIFEAVFPDFKLPIGVDEFYFAHLNRLRDESTGVVYPSLVLRHNRAWRDVQRLDMVLSAEGVTRDEPGLLANDTTSPRGVYLPKREEQDRFDVVARIMQAHPPR